MTTASHGWKPAARRGGHVLGYDEPRGRFKTYFFNDQGPYDSDLSSYEGEVVDNRLVFTGGARFSHALDPRRHVAINPDGSIDVEWFLRNAAGDWDAVAQSSLHPADRKITWDPERSAINQG